MSADEWSADCLWALCWPERFFFQQVLKCGKSASFCSYVPFHEGELGKLRSLPKQLAEGDGIQSFDCVLFLGPPFLFRCMQASPESGGLVTGTGGRVTEEVGITGCIWSSRVWPPHSLSGLKLPLESQGLTGLEVGVHGGKEEQQIKHTGLCQFRACLYDCLEGKLLIST